MSRTLTLFAAAGLALIATAASAQMLKTADTAAGKTFVDAYRTPHTEMLHVVERWKLTEGGNVLEVHMTIDDPGTFNQPWQAIRRFQRGQGTLTEEACAENNRNLFEYGIPEAQGPDF